MLYCKKIAAFLFLFCWGFMLDGNLVAQDDTDDLNLTEMIQPVDTALFFKDPHYFNWCNSIVKDRQGTYHLFYSRWPKAKGFASWLTHSVIAHAVSSSPHGPYKFKEIALKPRGKGFFDAYSTHNVRIVEDNNKYYMFYSGSNSGEAFFTPSRLDSIGQIGHAHKDRKIVRSSQRTGIAVSESLEGSWHRSLKPIVQPTGPIGVVAVNPTIAKGADDLYYMMIKGDDVRSKGIRLIQAIAIASKIEGPYTLMDKSAFDELRTEDAFMWFDKKRNRFYSIFHVHGGNFIGLITSEDGKEWRKAKNYCVCKKELHLKDGSVMKVNRMERPSIFFENGEPKVLSFAVKKNKDAFIVFMDLKK